ncbi:MAG: alpha/beta hydrolase family protein [Catenisphaera adipataccumulans]|uniref:alpha/beta hydrolase family protein n=1 Tax=Catenisphaera adipataccumulans TaxID=700500 RepID=UPI003D8DDE07
MKKGIALLICTILTTARMWGCGSPETEETTAASTAAESASPSPADRTLNESYSYSTRETWVSHDGRQIYGIAYIPDDGRTQHPLVIFAHELGENHTTGIPYAEHLAACGYAVYVFDFCGGSANGTENQSDGSSTEMSVRTEVRDLESVLDAARNWDFADPDHIALLGGSQGGFVSAVAAAENTDAVSALILMYPAFVIYDDVHERFSSLDEVPDTFGQWGGWITLGKIYAEDVWDYDPYEHISTYQGPVLILHGDRDTLVDISYGERAAEVYSNAEFHTISDGGHGFYGQPFEDALQYIKDFLAQHMPAET